MDTSRCVMNDEKLGDSTHDRILSQDPSGSGTTNADMNGDVGGLELHNTDNGGIGGIGGFQVLTQSQRQEQHRQSRQRRPSRQDSLSMFNQPRFSTSLSSFLNISERPSLSGGSGSGGLGSGSGAIQPGDLSTQIGRGFSIVNNLWQPQPPPSSQSASTVTTDAFLPPRFKTPVFSSSKQSGISNNSNNNNNNNNTIPQPPSQPPSKRNSLYFGSAEAPELDFFNQNSGNSQKRDSVGTMKPPMIVPSMGGTGGTNGSCIGKNTDFDSLFAPPMTGNLLSSSRNNSLKFTADDFDFPFKRRDSSTRNSIDAQNYTLGPRMFPQGSGTNSAELTPDPADVVDEALKGDEAVRGDQSVKRQKRSRDNETSTNNNDSHASPTTANDNSTSGVSHSIHATGGTANNSNTDTTNNNIDTTDNNTNNTTAATAITTSSGATSPSAATAQGTQNGHGDQDGIMMGSTQDAFSKLQGGILDPTMEASLDDTKRLLGVTKIDQLMLMIQARKKGVTEKIMTSSDGGLIIDENSEILPPSSQLVGGVEKPKGSHGVKQHECPYCHRFFTQSTHLEVHVRSHIGYKPFLCEYCGKRFTQGGNLRTHQRLHTGEKPYECELCGKRFSRKGNLAAHVVTHQKLKPFICKLDSCNKTFTQLGNMKAHQNRFHLKTLNALTQRLAEMDPHENISAAERDLLEYFASLYKNSNKGIKGRGKGSTRIAPTDFQRQHSASPSTVNGASSTTSDVQDNRADRNLTPIGANRPTSQRQDNASMPQFSHHQHFQHYTQHASPLHPNKDDPSLSASQFSNPLVASRILDPARSHITMNSNAATVAPTVPSQPTNDPVINYGYPALQQQANHQSGDPAGTGTLPSLPLQSHTSSANPTNAFAFSLDPQSDQMSGNGYARQLQAQVHFKNINYKG